MFFKLVPNARLLSVFENSNAASAQCINDEALSPEKYASLANCIV